MLKEKSENYYKITVCMTVDQVIYKNRQTDTQTRKINTLRTFSKVLRAYECTVRHSFWSPCSATY